ncbi:catechol 2,3-dioxygenase-like lactoylglutathione lyase family enzyme [Alteromonadaceae bacterium 2753L.S.0a.02]|nr:catechol 2,3-dioxygenase-like lactoylglutathione lyase family enzyme [Alteromonadaceae bacterium 2753L.S.0a.02]
MKRLHIHLGVRDLIQSIDFYTQLFNSKPNRVEEDYAKWQLQNPPLNFAISNRHDKPGVHHLGLEFDDTQALQNHRNRLASVFKAEAMLAEEAVECCYAVSDKYWLGDPQGVRWEQFATLREVDSRACCAPEAENASQCCAQTPQNACCE